MILRKYQETFVSDLSQRLAMGRRKIVGQMATGSGKTITFSAICERFTAKSGKDVLIIVHRKELLAQTRRALYEKFGISCQIIVAGMKCVPPARVYVGMVESLMRRLDKIKNIGLVIIDECHIASFNKVIEHFPDQYIIGFTATPLSNNKRKPLIQFYDDIVCGIDIPELIKSGNLCQNITYAPKDIVERAALTIKNGEFDDSVMAQEYSTPRYVKNVVQAYENWALGTKTMIFNVTIDHSKRVNDAFLLAGYESKHLDSSMTATERINILKWFRSTPGAILNNIGILTAGYDEPTIETIVINKATMSLPLWIQMTGRGSRPCENKKSFTIIDMGGNAVTHGDWCQKRDWADVFYNPKKIKESDGVAPVKSCPECNAIIPSQCKTCPYCGYVYPDKEEEVEGELSEFVCITKNINIDDLINENISRKEYYPFFKIGKELALEARKTIPVMTNEIANFILTKYEALASEWCKKKGKRYNEWHKERAKETLFREISYQYRKWKNPMEQLAPVASESDKKSFVLNDIVNIQDIKMI